MAQAGFQNTSISKNPGPGFHMHEPAKERYREPRKLKRMMFYANGDKYFHGKKISVSSKRYISLSDFLNDLTNRMPGHLNLHNGVRQIYTPVGGRRINNLEDLQDGEAYVCAGNEAFKPARYGRHDIEPWLKGRPHLPPSPAGRYLPSLVAQAPGSHYVGYNALPPRPFYRGALPVGRYMPMRGGQASQLRGGRGGEGHARPKVVTVVRNGPRPRNVIKVLLNRRSIQSFEQLMSDISEAFGPKWKNQRVKKVFNISGRELRATGDFFRDDDLFIAISTDDIAVDDVQDLLMELYPDSPMVDSLVHDWVKRRRKVEKRLQHRPSVDGPVTSQGPTGGQRRHLGVGSDVENRDSGFVESEASKEGDIASGEKATGGLDASGNHGTRKRRGGSIAYADSALDPASLGTDPSDGQDRVRAAIENREHARHRLQRRLDAERRQIDEERRRRGLPVMRPAYLQDPFRKMDQDREKERLARLRLKVEMERQERERQAKQWLEESEKAPQEVKESLDLSTKEVLPPIKVPIASTEKGAADDPDTGRETNEEVLDEEVVDSQRDPVESGDLNQETQEEEPQTEKIDDPTKEKAEVVPSSTTDTKKNRRSSRASPKRANKQYHSVKAESDENRSPEKRIDLFSDRRSSKSPDKQARKSVSPEKRPHKDTEAVSEKVSAEKVSKVSGEKDESKSPEKLPLKEQVQPSQDQQEAKTSSLSKKQVALISPVGLSPQTRKRGVQAPLGTTRPGKLARQVSNIQHILDRYELGKTLGDGNFAVVRLARKIETGREYAMKIIDKAKLKGKERMIENEIAIIKLCNHPNIVKLKEEYETEKEIYLVMELVKGGDLFDAITQSVKFKEAQASSMVNNMAQALFYLHSRRIVHRDLKPENLLVVRGKDSSLILKLADFGLAMEVTRDIHTVCGTPTYVAPEILEERGYGLEVDMWALGVITYILLCGFPPFRSPARSQTELFELIKSGRYEFLSPYWDNISHSVKDLISRLLVVDRRKRHTAVDVLSHPWIITIGGSVKVNKPMSAHRQTIKMQLEAKANADFEDYLQKKTDGEIPIP